MNRLFRLIVPVAGAAALAAVSASPALAHESRVVGTYKFTVGWKVEPAYSDANNAVQIFVRNLADNSAVTSGVADSVKVEVIFGSQKTDAMPLKTVFGSPGEYNASVLPTRPGTYTFHFTGAINGQSVDQMFTSSPTTFHSVEDAKSIQFPANDPTRGEIAQRQDRTDTRLQAAQSQITTLQSDLKQTRDSANTDLILAILGIAVGVLGLIALAVVVYLEMRRRRAQDKAREAAAAVAPSET